MKVISDDLTAFRSTDKLKVVCDRCDTEFSRAKRVIQQSRARYDSLDLCRSCSTRVSIAFKPQCSSAFWQDPAIKARHGATMRDSEAYRATIPSRKQRMSGAGNPMYGRKLSEETRKKMSGSRRGKTGENATAWKGGRRRPLFRLKKILQTRYQWFSRVLAREQRVCETCGDEATDAHHIVPLSILVRNLIAARQFGSDEEMLEWLLVQPAVVDPNLENGMALCRGCHRAAHVNWGSHVPAVRLPRKS